MARPAAELGVWLRGKRVGTVRSLRSGRLRFTYSERVLDEFPLNTPLLSCSLPVAMGEQDATAFFAGLLPEGEYRRALAEFAGVLPRDVFGILRRFGQDVAGAVVVADAMAVRANADALPYDDAALSREVAELATRPLAVYDDSELSIAGLQNKMLLVRQADGAWARPVHGFPSTHILKLDDRFQRGLVHAEGTCLALAQSIGLEAASAQIMTFAGLECIVVERFDREISSSGPPIRLHQEDACQALGVDLEQLAGRSKYEADGGPGFRSIAALLGKWSNDPQQQLLRLLDALVFTVAIGNADAHGKNLALLLDESGAVRLAPLYDTVPTALWPNLRTRAAMSVGGAIDMPDINLDDIVAEARRWRLPDGEIIARTRTLLENLIESCGSMDESAHQGTIEFVPANVARLLAAR